MVLQIFPDTGQVPHGREAKAAQALAVADAGQLEQLRRCDRAGRQDHLAGRPGEMARSAALENHASRSRAITRDALDVDAGLQAQVRATERGLEEAARRAPTPA